MPTFDLLTIGHSNIPADRFIGLLRGAGANAIADVRSTPASRRFPWFCQKQPRGPPATGRHGLSAVRRHARRPAPRAGLYRDGVADYEAMAKRPEFRSGLDRLCAAAARHCVCLMCAEREPLDCHRCLLVARALAERGIGVGHILHDGTVDAARRHRAAALGGLRRGRRSVQHWTERPTRGSVSPPRPCGRVSGEGGFFGGERSSGDEIMSVLFRALVIAFATGIGPALAQGTGLEAGRAASTVDTTPPGTLNPKPLPPLAHPDRQGYAGEGIVCPQADAVSRPGARHRLVCGRLHGRRGAAADHRADLAGDAAVAQSQLGQSGTHQVHRAGSARTPRRPAGTDC